MESEGCVLKNMTFADKLFEYAIAAPCFAPERDGRFSSRQIRAMAYFALRSLWRAQGIRYQSCYFDQSVIRLILRTDLLPEYIDDAILLWMMKQDHSFHDLAYAILYVVLVGNAFYKEAAATYSKPDYNVLYHAWLDFRAHAKITFAPIVPEGRVAHAV